MATKKIVVLHSQVPFVRGGAEMLVESLTKQLCLRGYQAELVSIPFQWPYCRELLNSCFFWRTADLTESNGERIDLAIATKVPSYMVQHPNKVVWLMHQFRQAYDLRDNAVAGGLNSVPGGREMIEKFTALDTMGIGEARAAYSISQNVTNRLKHYNGLDSTPLYHPPMLAGRYKSGEYGDYILTVGRLDFNKRFDLLVRALPYCDRHIRAKIAGKGPELEKIRGLAAQLGVEDRVDFLGFVPDDDIVDLYANALAVCYPPIDEDYGYVTLEAFLSQKPILTCRDSGGVLEFARHGENGYVVDFDAHQLGEAINKLYRNKGLARDQGLAGYERVKDISWDNVIDELTKTLR